jgi:Family of unknown function (DUF6220)
MGKLNDTLAELDLNASGWLSFAARLLPTGQLGQFVTAGGALFNDTGLERLHALFGGALSLPAAALLSGAFLVSRLQRFCGVRSSYAED